MTVNWNLLILTRAYKHCCGHRISDAAKSCSECTRCIVVTWSYRLSYHNIDRRRYCVQRQRSAKVNTSWHQSAISCNRHTDSPHTQLYVVARKTCQWPTSYTFTFQLSTEFVTLKASQNYSAKYLALLRHAVNNGLVLCHPIHVLGNLEKCIKAVNYTKPISWKAGCREDHNLHRKGQTFSREIICDQLHHRTNQMSLNLDYRAHN